MALDTLVQSLISYAEKNPHDECVSQEIISWIRKHGEFAFVKENLEGHLTGSLWIMNPPRDKVLLMFHNRFQQWTQFGGHCDGEVDVLSVAVREFHEESGILEEPELIGDIFSVQLWDIAARTSSSGMYQPEHKHYDILYLATISEDITFSRQEDEVDDIRWFEIDGIEKYIGEKRMLDMIEKIKSV